MDAVKRHLLFDDKLQQIQAVHALYKMTETKVGKMSVIGFQSTHQVPELEYLLNLCCHGDVAISQTAQQCMVSMLNQKLVDLEGCIKNTLKLVSTVPDLTSLLTFLVSLMELQMTSMGLNCPVHPLVKVYEITSADQWQQLAVAFSNSLFTINKLSSASQQECRWKELMTYHKVFLEALVSSTTDKCSGILSMAISTCISYHQYLDYTICTLIEILQQTQNIFSSNNVMVLEILWQAVGMQTPGERVCTLLVEFTLAVAVSSTISYNIWKLIDSRAIQMVTVYNNHRVLAVLLHSHLNCESQVLSCILNLTKRAVTVGSTPTSSILLLPLLELISALSICKPTEKSLMSSVEECVVAIESQLPLHDSVDTTSNTVTCEPASRYVTQLGDPEHLLSPDYLNSILINSDSALLYLQSVNLQLEAGGAPSTLTVYMTSAILVSTRSTRVQLAAIDTIKKLVISQPNQSSGLFLVVIHWNKRHLHPDVTLSALLSLPSFAAHKYNLPVVIKYLLRLGTSSQTSPLSIRLLCDLATLQPKAIPYLMQTIHSTKLDTTHSVAVAKAKAIYHICDLRPELYIAEVLPDLNQTLATRTSQPEEVVLLSIQTLCILVEYEVLDIMSTWEVIASHFSSAQKSRPLEIAGMCEFLGLSADFKEPLTPPLQDFQDMALSTLWRYTADTSCLVVSAAFTALSKFPFDSMKYSHMSEQTQLTYAADYSDNREKYDSGLINGAAVLDLLTEQHSGSLPGYQTLLNSLITTEARNLGVGITRKSVNAGSAVPKSLQKIPQLVSSRYGAVKNKPNSAVALGNSIVGMLSCTVTEKLKEGSSSSEVRRIYSMSKQNSEMLSRFIMNSASLSSAENWLYNEQLLAGWKSYIHHALLTCIEGRRANLVISNQPSSPPFLELVCLTKDHLDTVICTSAKHDEISQSSTLIALTSLVSVIRQLLDGVKHTDLPTSLIKWEQNILEGLIATSCGQPYKAGFPWLTTSGSDLITSTGLCCLSMLPYSVYVANETSLYTVLTSLLDTLLSKAAGSQNSHFAGTSLGHILAELFGHSYQDIADHQLIEKIDECVQYLTTESVKLSHTGGCTLGMLKLLPALFSDSTKCNIHDLYDRLAAQTENADASSVAWYARGLLAAQLHLLNKWPGDISDEVEFLLSRLSLVEAAQLGACVLVSTLAQEYHESSAEWINFLQDFLLTEYEGSTENDCNVPDLHLSALFLLTGATQLQPGETDLHPLAVTTAEKLVGVLSSADVKSNSKVWMMASLYRIYNSSSSPSHSRDLAPTYKHTLPQSSILRHAVDSLHGYIKAKLKLTSQQLVTLLRCITAAAEVKQLPPLQWSALLLPLMRHSSESNEIQSLSIRIAASQCKGCLLSSAFVSRWCSPQLYNTLSIEGQVALLAVFEKCIDYIRVSKLDVFRDQCWLPMLSQENESEKPPILYLIASLHQIVKNFTLCSPSTQTFAYETLIKLCQGLSTRHPLYTNLVDELCTCLGSCESTLTAHIFTHLRNSTTALHLACKLLNKTSALEVLVRAIEAVALKCDTEWLLRLTYPCWAALTSNQSMEFLVSIQTLTRDSCDMEYCEMWLQILCSAVICWAKGKPCWKQLPALLKINLHKLMSESPWTQLSNQTQDWMEQMRLKKGFTAAWFS